MTPNTYATAFPRDEQWGEFLPWREKVGHLPEFHEENCCPAVQVDPRGVEFFCCRPEGHDGPHIATGFHTVYNVWEDPS